MIGPKEKKEWPFYARRGFLGEKKGLDPNLTLCYGFMSFHTSIKGAQYENFSRSGSKRWVW